MPIARHNQQESPPRAGGQVRAKGQVHDNAQALYASLSEVDRAKLELLDMCRPAKESQTIVQRHPFASVGVAMALGMIMVKSTTLRTIGKAGMHTGMHTLMTRVIRSMF